MLDRRSPSVLSYMIPSFSSRSSSDRSLPRRTSGRELTKTVLVVLAVEAVETAITAYAAAALL